jgi:hypothetical protein
MKKRSHFLKNLNATIHDDILVGIGSLLILSIVDLTSIIVFFLSISVDALTSAQFIALGIVAVLFKVRARSKRQNVAWFFGAFITFFGGFMFMMNTVIIQGDDSKPDYVTRAESDYNTSRAKVDDLLFDQAEYRKKNQRTIAVEMESSITAAREAETELSVALVNAETRWKNEPEKRIRAVEVFARIPYIIQNPSSGVIIAAIFFAILFAWIELTIFSVAGEIGKPIIKAEKLVRREKVKPQGIPESFDDVTDAEYKAIAEYPDGSVRLPEQAAGILRISAEEAEGMHAKLYAGYIYRDGKYVKIGGMK